jgi:hypothetical protein
MSEALGTSRGRKTLTPEEWKMLQEHLTVILDHDKHIVEIGWASGCKEESCTFPKFTVIFYSCPQRPCPPPTS